MSRSTKAGLNFPVGRIDRHLKNGRYAERVAAGAPVYLAAVLEYLVAEVLELAGNSTRQAKKLRIVPRHIQIAVQSDEELSKLFPRSAILGGGVPPKADSYKVYISKVLKQVHPDTGISSKSMSIVNSMVTDMFEQIAAEAGRLVKTGKKATLTSRDVQAATRVLLPSELARHAISEGTKAVTQFTSA